MIYLKRLEYEIMETNKFFGNTVNLTLVPKNKDQTLHFKPGQYGLISFRRGKKWSLERPFSFAGNPDQLGKLEFGFRVLGRFTSEVARLKKGDTVFVRGPYGAFIYDEKKYPDVVFLAAGIGITPFLSAIRYVTLGKLSGRQTLIYCNNSEQAIPFFEELQQLSTVNPHLHVHHVITQPAGSLDPKEFRVGRISTAMIWSVVGNELTGKTFFLCGPEGFMATAIECLKELGVQDKAIKTEGFSQVPLSFFEKGTGVFPLVVGLSTLMALAILYAIYLHDNTGFLAHEGALNSPQTVAFQFEFDQKKMHSDIFKMGS